MMIMRTLMQMRCRLNDKNGDRDENDNEDDDAQLLLDEDDDDDEDDDTHLLLDPVLDPTETALLLL